MRHWRKNADGQAAPLLEFCASIVISYPLSNLDGNQQQPALALADRLSRYGGTMVVLIHPNVLDHKLDFEQRLESTLRTRA